MSLPLRIAMVAGEPSGDLLGARIIDALRLRCPDVAIEGIGGARMVDRGFVSHAPMERLSVMGFTEPLLRLPELLHIRRSLGKRYRGDPPDAFLGIDAPDFNLYLERQLRRAGVVTAHLGSPSVWAWRKGRLQKIAKAVDEMFCLFPFETEAYEGRGIPVRFVGHPLADEIPLYSDARAARQQLELPVNGRIVALLPGSRAGEVARLAPVFLQVAAMLWDADHRLSFVVPAATPELAQQLRVHLQAHPTLPVTLVDGRAREAITAAELVLAASGTATLEAALLKRPMVVAYRMGAVSWSVLSRLVETDWVALPNLLAGEGVVPEYLQAAVTAENLANAMRALLEDEASTAAMNETFEGIHQRLKMDCANQVAEALLRLTGREDCL